MELFKLPSGLKVNKEWKPNKTEFFEVLGVHSPFKRMQEDRRKDAIEKDWKVYSKALGKDKKEESN